MSAFGGKADITAERPAACQRKSRAMRAEKYAALATERPARGEPEISAALSVRQTRGGTSTGTARARQNYMVGLTLSPRGLGGVGTPFSVHRFEDGLLHTKCPNRASKRYPEVTHW